MWRIPCSYRRYCSPRQSPFFAVRVPTILQISGLSGGGVLQEPICRGKSPLKTFIPKICHRYGENLLLCLFCTANYCSVNTADYDDLAKDLHISQMERRRDWNVRIRRVMIILLWSSAMME